MRRAKILRWALDLILIAAVGITAWRAEGWYEYRKREREAVAQDASFVPVGIGSAVSGVDLDLTKKARHVLLAVSSSCPGCRASVGLYRELLDAARELGGWQVTFVSESSDANAQSWLSQEYGSSFNMASIAAFPAIGVWGTPTLLLLSESGAVTDIVIGKLRAEDEAQLWDRLAAFDRTAPLNNSYTPVELSHEEFAVLNPTLPQMLDFRDRKTFAASPTSAARNIPIGELETRALVELDSGRTVGILCQPGQVSWCRAVAHSLRRLQFEDIVLITS